MKKLFVNYKTALLLQQLGFKEECLGYYKQERYKQKYHRITIQKAGIQFPLDYKYAVVAPTHTQVQEWLIRTYAIELTIYKQNEENIFSCAVCDVYSDEDSNSIWFTTKEYTDYFDALNQGILEALEFIIKNKIEQLEQQ